MLKKIVPISFSINEMSTDLCLFVKKSTFHVRGHGWYIDCYPCGIDEDSDTRWESVCLCLSDHKEQVKAGCLPVHSCDGSDMMFNSYEAIEEQDIRDQHTYNADTLWRRCLDGFLQWDSDWTLNLEGDYLQIRCEVYILTDEFPAAVPLS
jgi:speckle-type POZ protein